MFAELRLVAPPPDRQESYGGKLAHVMRKAFLASFLPDVDVVITGSCAGRASQICSAAATAAAQPTLLHATHANQRKHAACVRDRATFFNLHCILIKIRPFFLNPRLFSSLGARQ